jgi:hypothetical protein
MKSRAKRDSHFRPGYEASPYTQTKEGFVKVPGWGPRKRSKHQPPLGIREMLNRAGLTTTKELASACRAGRLPPWRYDRLTGTVLWHRLETEACLYWQRAKAIRDAARSSGMRRTRPGQTSSVINFLVKSVRDERAEILRPNHLARSPTLCR